MFSIKIIKELEFQGCFVSLILVPAEGSVALMQKLALPP